VLYNMFLGYGYTDLNGVFWNPVLYDPLPQLRLPIMPFQLLIPSLSLLLVFRTNASYGRWAEARQQWSIMETECRNVMRMAAAWSSPMREPDIDKRVEHIGEVGDVCYVFLRSLLRHVSGPPDEEEFCVDVKKALPEKEADAILAAGNRHFRSLYFLSRKIEALPLSERQRVEVDKACVIIGDTAGGTERLYGTPVPRGYSRQASRFITTWLFFLPFGLYDTFDFTWNHIALIPASVMISAFLFIIEELSVQLEEPFGVLPLPGIVQDIKAFANQLPQWHAMYTNEEYNMNVYGGEEVPTNVKIGKRYARPTPGTRPVPKDAEELPFYIKWSRSSIGTSRKPEKFVPTPDEYNYTPSFEDFIPVKLGSFEFISDKISRKKFNDMSVGEMKQVYAEVDKLEEMVRGSGNELGLIKNRVDDLGNKAAQLKSRSSTPIIDISSNGIEVEEDVTSMMTDVQSLQNLVQSQNSDIGTLKDRVQSFQERTEAAKQRAVSQTTKPVLDYMRPAQQPECSPMTQESVDEVRALRDIVAAKNSDISEIRQRIQSLSSKTRNLQDRAKRD